MPTDNAAIVQRFIDDVINQGRYQVCDEIVAEDFVELDPLPGQRQGREGLKEVIAMMRSAFPDINWVTDESISSGDKVVTRFTWTGTQHGDFLGIPATGRPVSVKGVVIDRLVNGLMTDSRILMDTYGMMMQLGVIPPPADPAQTGGPSSHRRAGSFPTGTLRMRSGPGRVDQAAFCERIHCLDLMSYIFGEFFYTFIPKGLTLMAAG